MKKQFYITGFENVSRNLNKEIAGIKHRTTRGMRKSVLLVKGRAQKFAPVDTGHLKASAYTAVGKSLGGEIWGIVGFTAAYAPYVHEMEMKHQGEQRKGRNPLTGAKKKGFYWDPQGKARPQFLRQSMQLSADEVLTILWSEALIVRSGRR